MAIDVSQLCTELASQSTQLQIQSKIMLQKSIIYPLGIIGIVTFLLLLIIGLIVVRGKKAIIYFWISLLLYTLMWLAIIFGVIFPLWANIGG